MTSVQSAAQSVPHPWPTGWIFYSPGAHLCYRVIGPCCRLFDREQLPWPCCRLDWRGKEPSWRRVGKRFVPDMSTRNSPSYAVQILDQGGQQTFVTTLFTHKLTPEQREWWYSRKPASGQDLVTPESITDSASSAIPEQPLAVP